MCKWVNHQLVGLVISVILAYIQLANSLEPEFCEGDHPVEDDITGIHTIDIDSCRSMEDCSIKKGQDLTINSLLFNSKADSKSVQLQLILGSEGDNNQPVQTQMFSVNLCAIQKYRTMLGGSSENTECQVEKERPYQLSDLQFFIARLMPAGNVNITFLLTGHDVILSCALIRVNLID